MVPQRFVLRAQANLAPIPLQTLYPFEHFPRQAVRVIRVEYRSGLVRLDQFRTSAAIGYNYGQPTIIGFIAYARQGFCPEAWDNHQID